MSKVSAVISDVDGTLVTKEKVLTPRTQEAVRKLNEAGIPFILTSARPPRGLRMFIEPLKLKGPIAGCNGGLFVNPDMSMVEEHPLEEDVARQALQLIQDQKLDPWVFTYDQCYVLDANGPHVKHEEKTVQFAPTVTQNFDEPIKKAFKIVGVSDNPDLIQQCERDMQKALGDAATVMRSQAYYLDITHREANKGTVVLNIAKLLSIPPSEILTIGDGHNDVMMFEKSGLSIAMGNADPDVKKKASYVTASNLEDGFATGIERYVLGL